MIVWYEKNISTVSAMLCMGATFVKIDIALDGGQVKIM